MPAGLKTLPPARLAAMESDDFNSFFQGSPIRRIGSDHLRRNIENGHF